MVTPLDCAWSAWTPWTECTALCNKEATQTRSRTVAVKAGPGGAVCICCAGIFFPRVSLLLVRKLNASHSHVLETRLRPRPARVLLVLSLVLGMTGVNGLLVLWRAVLDNSPARAPSRPMLNMEELYVLFFFFFC